MIFGESMATKFKTFDPNGISFELSQVELEMIALFRKRTELCKRLPTHWVFEFSYVPECASARFIDKEDIRISHGERE